MYIYIVCTKAKVAKGGAYLRDTTVYIAGEFFMYLVSRLGLGTRLYLCVQWVDGCMKYQNTPITFQGRS